MALPRQSSCDHRGVHLRQRAARAPGGNANRSLFE
jgi:hypothetical protein